MEIFKIFESTVTDLKPGHVRTKDLRRDQLLDNYDEATKRLQTLIRAKENEITYRRDLLEMLEKSKTEFDNKLMQAKQAYQTAKKNAPPESQSDARSASSKPKVGSSGGAASSSNSNSNSTTSKSTTPPLPLPPMVSPSKPSMAVQQSPAGSQQSVSRNSDLDLPMAGDSVESRSSLDRRLSEFLKTFPNLTQAGLAPPTNNNNDIKPSPGYYTQQPPPPPPPVAPIAAAANAAPLMAMMRFPPPLVVPPPGTQTIATVNHSSNENHDSADMDLSDYDEPNIPSGSTATTPGGDLIPMVASAMKSGAGGNQHLQAEQAYVAGQQQFNNPLQYAPRLNPLAFDPSIMDTGLTPASSGSSNREKHTHSSERGSSHSKHISVSGGSSSSSTGKHGSDRSKYSSSSSSSHSSSRSKRR